jgi:acid phosphatase family membrane protein YuiD
MASNITTEYLEGAENGGIGSIFHNGAFVASFLGFLFAQARDRPLWSSLVVLAHAPTLPRTSLSPHLTSSHLISPHLIAQIAKIFTHYYVNQEWDLSRCYSSGGMPSSHTSLVMGLTTAIAMLYGMSSPFFAISLMFSLIVMYDATGVRLHAGKQASVLNMIITELPPDHPVSSNTVALKDSLGHTPVQVVMGAIVGVVIGYLVGLLYR